MFNLFKLFLCDTQQLRSYEVAVDISLTGIGTGCHFTGDFLKYICMTNNAFIFIKTSLKIVPEGAIYNNHFPNQ